MRSARKAQPRPGADESAREVSRRANRAAEGLRILSVRDEAGADRARSLAFNALEIAPASAEARLTPLESAARDGLTVIVNIPWRTHPPDSALARDKPGWFAPARADDGAVADPRKPATDENRQLATRRAELHGEQAGWLAGAVAALADSGARGVRLSGLHHAPEAFWRRFADALRTQAPDALLIADALGGTQRALARLDGAGFDAFCNSAAWWNGEDGWFFDELESLPTPQIATAFAPAVNGADALARLGRAVLSSQGYIVPDNVLADDDLEEQIRAVNTFRDAALWLDEPGPLIPAGGGALVRAHGDPRFAENALVLAPHGAEAEANAVLGGAFDFDTVAQSGQVRLLSGRRRAPRVSRGPDRATSEKNLSALADARIAIENVYPEIDGGRFAAKRVAGDALEVGADIFCDGHEKIAACFWLHEPGADAPSRHEMTPRGNDRWTGQAVLSRTGRASFTIEAWRDLFATWRSDFEKKRAAGQHVGLELIEGASLVRKTFDHLDPNRLGADERSFMSATDEALTGAGEDAEALAAALLNDSLAHFMTRRAERVNLTRYEKQVELIVDRRQARFSAWYELFPRSQSGRTDRHGTFDDVIARLPYIRDLGFDVLYFPPIHPIGRTNRKGRNNSLIAEPGDVGSPYAIGGPEGGHDAIHPELGGLADFERLVAAAAEHGMEIALDFAIQCSPDHPWLKENPEWFDWRPDGTIKFAENPPKKYEDIVNVHFYRDAIPDLWFALRDVVLFWCERGIRLFRVDNPHTKPYPFWEWLIAEVKEVFPDALFLSEAFTRPKVMKRLAKLGFTQSYTYFTWRNTKRELIDYVTELAAAPTRETMNPNFFVNTPDINPEPLQTNNRAAYIARIVLAGTLASSYGVYNGVEIAEGAPVPGKEEYLHSEKYEIRAWNMDRPGHIKDEIRFLNRLRQRRPALHNHVGVQFLNAWNDHILWYAKRTPDLTDYLLFAVSLDFNAPQTTECEIPLWEFGLPDDGAIETENLLTGARFIWRGKIQRLDLSPDAIFSAFRLIPPAGFARPDNAPLYADPEARP